VPCKVYVGNMPWVVGDTELKQLFEPFGEVHQAEVVTDRRNRRPRGFGFVHMHSKDSAERAVAALHGMSWHNRQLKVAKAKEVPPVVDAEGE
jgi:RNA recognition motif-containing protein